MHHLSGKLPEILEFLGMSWMAVLFIISIPILLIDVVTLWGFLLPRISPSLRGLALSIGIVFSMVAFFQGMRSPAVERFNVNLPDLPEALNGTVIIALSDMHLGSQLGKKWLTKRIAQVNEQNADMVVLLGDIFEGHGPLEDRFADLFRQLSAPYGVWAILGNHEFYGGNKIDIYRSAGHNVLINDWAQPRPGLILAGVEDLTISKRNGKNSDPISQALRNRPSGATILLSHTPWSTKKRRQMMSG
jgi:predicted MPP superfamily phosphohydrolase